MEMIISLRETLLGVMAREGLKQTDIALQTGVSQPLLSLFLSGKRGVGGEHALALKAYCEDFAEQKQK